MINDKTYWCQSVISDDSANLTKTTGPYSAPCGRTRPVLQNFTTQRIGRKSCRKPAYFMGKARVFLVFPVDFPLKILKQSIGLIIPSNDLIYSADLSFSGASSTAVSEEFLYQRKLFCLHLSDVKSHGRPWMSMGKPLKAGIWGQN